MCQRCDPTRDEVDYTEEDAPCECEKSLEEEFESVLFDEQS